MSALHCLAQIGRAIELAIFFNRHLCTNSHAAVRTGRLVFP